VSSQRRLIWGESPQTSSLPKSTQSGGTMKVQNVRLLLMTAFCALSMTCLHAQSSAPQAAATPAPSSSYKPITLGKIRFSGSLRVRPEIWDWFDTQAADPTYMYYASTLRLSLSQELTSLDWQVEFENPLLLGLPDNSVAPPPQGQLGLGATYYVVNDESRAAAGLFLKQGFLRWKGLFGDKKSSLRFGRFEVVDGSETTPADPTLAALKRDRIAHRLVGTFVFSHVGRSFDGAQYVRQGSTNITILGGRATEGVFLANGWDDMDTDILYGAATHGVGKTSPGEFRVFALSYHDGRRAPKVDNRPAAAIAADQHNIRLTSIGGHYIQTFPAGTGKLDVLLWGAGQFGNWGVLEHRAGAIAVEGGFQPKMKLKPWIRGGYSYSTGDDDPNDSVHGTFFQVLPTPRIYARFPFFNVMNNQDAFGELILRPHPKWTLRSDIHLLRLSNEHDLWYSGGGAFQQEKIFGFTGRPSHGSQSLSSLYDLSVDYVINPHLSVTGYYGVATGRTVIAKIYPNGETGQLGYGELSWKF